MVPMLRPDLLKLSSGSWDKRGWFPTLAWRKLSGTMGSPPGGLGVGYISCGHQGTALLASPNPGTGGCLGMGFPLY